MVYTKSTLAEQTTPAALELTDVSEIVCNLSFGGAATSGHVTRQEPAA